MSLFILLWYPSFSNILLITAPLYPPLNLTNLTNCTFYIKRHQFGDINIANIVNFITNL